MCDFCRHILRSVALPHKEDKCPLQKSQYCGYCQQYGHTTSRCSKHIFVTNDFIETDDSSYSESAPSKPVLDVVDTPHCIRAVLSAFQIRLSGRHKENQRRLRHIAECGRCLHGDEEKREACLYAGKPASELHRGRRLVLHKPMVVIKNEQ